MSIRKMECKIDLRYVGAAPESSRQRGETTDVLREWWPPRSEILEEESPGAIQPGAT